MAGLDGGVDSGSTLWLCFHCVFLRAPGLETCGNDVALEPTFLSLPDDVNLAILERVAGAADLARARHICAALRRLVAERDRELWKPELLAWFDDIYGLPSNDSQLLRLTPSPSEGSRG
ncbi:hypothetical protein EJB05_35170, partial [Eragrostis curvula]